MFPGSILGAPASLPAMLPWTSAAKPVRSPSEDEKTTAQKQAMVFLK
jgi:hypothetical protein